jgi:hypothetical protein
VTKENRPAATGRLDDLAVTDQCNALGEIAITASRAVSSQQVSWWDVHEWVAPILDRIGTWPTAGSPAWSALDSTDPRKLAALLDGAQHHVLRVETAQQALAEASRDVSAAADWSAVAQHIRERQEFCTAHPWSKRVKA